MKKINFVLISNNSEKPTIFFLWLKKFNDNLTRAMTPEMNTVGLGGLKKKIKGITFTKYLEDKKSKACHTK